MRKFLLLAALLLAASGLRAQTLPEFGLTIHFTDTLSDGSVSNFSPREIGYDSRATDSLDPSFGEDEYPGGLSPDQDFYFTRPDLFGGQPDEGTIDIMHKPSLDSFAIDYTTFVSFSYFPGSLYWDTTQIPPQITGIWLRPSWSTTPFVDMKHTGIFTVPRPDTQGIWGMNYVITVFYNMQPRFIPTAAVNEAPSSSGLLVNATVFPNPMPSSGTLDVQLSEPAALSIVGYDIAGREVLRMANSANMGENVFNLSSLPDNVHGAVLLRVDAESGSREETKNIMLIRP